MEVQGDWVVSYTGSLVPASTNVTFDSRTYPHNHDALLKLKAIVFWEYFTSTSTGGHHCASEVNTGVALMVFHQGLTIYATLYDIR